MITDIINTYTINSFIKTFVMNGCVYYSCNKISSSSKINNKFNFILINFIITVVYTVLNIYVNKILLLLAMYLLWGCIISKLINNRIGYTLILVAVSYAICNVALFLSVFFGFFIYKMICEENEVVGAIANSLAQTILIVAFFKIKRFKNGFDFMNKKLNKDEFDMIVVYVSTGLILLACLIGSLYDTKYEIVENIFITFIILGITMYIMIQRTITMQYKHSLLLKTLEEYKEEIDNKNKEIEKLSEEKFKTSKIRHEFFNRQKALELMVKQNMSGDISKDGVSENVLKIVNELTSEYSKECEIIKGLAPLPKTDIIEIDSLFTYMQTECAKNNIDFKLNIQDSVHPLVNNHISKSRLETLLGDHIRDAINAVNKSDTSNKEILVVLGLKEDNYEICILDNGVEFSIDTLVKLGKEQVTTGGTGIGFLTTFETLKETKASLVITEFESGEYTKSVAVVFNNNCEYVINSYRAKEIIKSNDRKDVIIKEMKD